MPVDTRNKRGSVLQHQNWLPIFPDPDGDLANPADRRQLGRIYAGLFADMDGDLGIHWDVVWQDVWQAVWQDTMTFPATIASVSGCVSDIIVESNIDDFSVERSVVDTITVEADIAIGVVSC